MPKKMNCNMCMVHPRGKNRCKFALFLQFSSDVTVHRAMRYPKLHILVGKRIIYHDLPLNCGGPPLQIHRSMLQWQHGSSLSVSVGTICKQKTNGLVMRICTGLHQQRHGFDTSAPCCNGAQNSRTSSRTFAGTEVRTSSGISASFSRKSRCRNRVTPIGCQGLLHHLASLALDLSSIKHRNLFAGSLKTHLHCWCKEATWKSAKVAKR